MNTCNTPILLMAFNRPKETAEVLHAIRQARPKQLFIALDAPRVGNVHDAAACKEVGTLLERGIDWPCAVEKLVQKENLGGHFAPAQAITWFFSKVDRGIILEDDCVPDQSFFSFCEELLERYKDSEKVMHISANSYQGGHQRGSGSYYFSKYPHIWGWATWRRAWNHFDHSLLSQSDRVHVWDSVWQKSLRRSGGLALTPQVNMVRNIGFGEQATHTKGVGTPYDVSPITFPLTHPPTTVWNMIADYYTFKHHYNYSLSKAIFYKIKQYI